jgi:hypothetical protein
MKVTKFSIVNNQKKVEKYVLKRDKSHKLAT